ncbi:WSC domain-containing protein [Lactarius akahatsu]|uniref:WSC domain-containing protein n=1 Tax=Lactarius akahatsu TaxID=416441 RepID=A0AAD4LEG4_9AGAM|nr:WSC domain-containing protein [Lactarius akahatsu]
MPDNFSLSSLRRPWNVCPTYGMWPFISSVEAIHPDPAKNIAMHRPSFLALASVFSAQVLAASVHSTRSLDPSGWTSFICMEDNRIMGLPLLTGAYYADPANMTIENCVAFCDSQPVSYRFMAVTNGFECSCDNFFEHVFENVGPTCNTPCRGNPSEVGGCGGFDDGQPKASSYERINSTFVIPALVPSVGLWNGLGCYNDSVSARALQVRVEAGNTTVGSCVAACQAQGFSLAGVEFGRECWCGSQLQHGSAFFGNSDGIRNGNFRNYPDEPHCNMACQGDPTKICGGPALLNLYNFTGTYPSEPLLWQLLAGGPHEAAIVTRYPRARLGSALTHWQGV